MKCVVVAAAATATTRCRLQRMAITLIMRLQNQKTQYTLATTSHQQNVVRCGDRPAFATHTYGRRPFGLPNPLPDVANGVCPTARHDALHPLGQLPRPEFSVQSTPRNVSLDMIFFHSAIGYAQLLTLGALCVADIDIAIDIDTYMCI